MKRVVEIVGRMERAGQETFLMNLLRSYDPSKYEIWFSVDTEQIGAYESEILELGGKIWHNPYKPGLRNIFNYLRAFKHFLKECGPFDVAHCHVFYFGGFMLSVARQVKVPVRIMHSHSTGDVKGNSLIRKLYRKLCLFLINKNATHKVACGKEAYHALFKQDCKNQDFILNNGILMNLFNHGIEDKEKKRQSLSINDSTVVVINVARFFEVKNHEKIVSVFESYHNRINSDSVLLLVGDGERLEIIKELVSEKGLSKSIFFLGQRDDIPSLLNASDVLLMPSLFEGLPVSLVEAQAAGLPCIISKTITNEVDMGMGLIRFLDINDPDEIWAHGIEEMRAITRPPFSVRCERIDKAGYSIESTWKKISKIYG